MSYSIGAGLFETRQQQILAEAERAEGLRRAEIETRLARQGVT